MIRDLNNEIRLRVAGKMQRSAIYKSEEAAFLQGADDCCTEWLPKVLEMFENPQTEPSELEFAMQMTEEAEKIWSRKGYSGIRYETWLKGMLAAEESLLDMINETEQGK